MGALANAAAAMVLFVTASAAPAPPPSDPVALAQEQLAAGRTETAISTMRRAVAREPDNAAFHAKLGYLFRYAGLKDRSIAAYRMSESLDPSPENLVSAEGQISKAQIHAGDFAAAARTRARVAALAHENGLPIDEKMHFYDGVTALFAGRTDDAIRAFDASEAAGADTIWSKFARAYRDLARGDREATLADARRLEPLAETRDGERHYRIAHLYAGAGDKAAALRAIKAAIDAGFHDPSAYENEPPFAALRDDPAFRKLLAKARARRAETERAVAAPLRATDK